MSTINSINKDMKHNSRLSMRRMKKTTRKMNHGRNKEIQVSNCGRWQRLDLMLKSILHTETLQIRKYPSLMMLAIDLNQNIVQIHPKIKNKLTLMKYLIKRLYPMMRYITHP